jgi:hypothetical protein
VTYTTTEGVAAVDEAIAFLNEASPIAPLGREDGMDLACKDHVEDQGETGSTGHFGIDNSSPLFDLIGMESGNIRQGRTLCMGQQLVIT